MARFAACIAVDFTFKTASRFTVSRRQHGKIVVSKVHATLCTIVGQHGILVAGQIGGGHENAARMFIPVTEIFRQRQALSREVGVASSQVAAVAVDNPASTTKTLLLAVASVWAVATGALKSTEVHMDHWHFVQRVRAVARSYHQPDSYLFATIWGMFGVWLIKPSLGVCAEYLTAQCVPTHCTHCTLCTRCTHCTRCTRCTHCTHCTFYTVLPLWGIHLPAPYAPTWPGQSPQYAIKQGT